MESLYFLFNQAPGEPDYIFYIPFNMIHILAEGSLNGVAAGFIIGLVCIDVSP